MSVSHAPSFLHTHHGLHRRTERRSRTELNRRHKANLILGGVGIFLFGVLVTGFIGLATTAAPRPGPSSSYGADGSWYVSPPHMATLWLAVIMMSVVALFAYGLITANHNQQ
ncbi:hypothetical protein [Microlunatus sp. Gsoil 973]|uniref:hypothetical protein n=1 Tax=Microlunatus sp. Gsoil 973 TaxID=2672569 RepID=UPI0012B4D39B|nr:hypothetical protein [Microlunatus sp. Gsoil 973]QGN33487.1 hypothetical protein GJV80_12440 [Microlunatus sp. Gsoil 973]